MMTSIKNAVTKAIYDCFGNAVYTSHQEIALELFEDYA